MDYGYAILGVIVIVMLIAAFSFVNNVPSWGPDLTDELPAYLVAESLSRFNMKPGVEEQMISVPSKPKTRSTAPLLKYYRGNSSVVVV